MSASVWYVNGMCVCFLILEKKPIYWSAFTSHFYNSKVQAFGMIGTYRGWHDNLPKEMTFSQADSDFLIQWFISWANEIQKLQQIEQRHEKAKMRLFHWQLTSILVKHWVLSRYDDEQAWECDSIMTDKFEMQICT